MLLDVQGFKDNNNRFIVKEIYIETKNLQFHDIIKSPSIIEKNLDRKHKKQSNWLTKNYHGFAWTDGYITLGELRQTLFSIFNDKSMQIYVKGEEKIKWVKQIMGNEALNCKNVENEYYDVQPEEREKCWACKKHKHIKESNKIHCALENVKILKKWFMRQKNNKKNNNDQICKNEFSLHSYADQTTSSTSTSENQTQ